MELCIQKRSSWKSRRHSHPSIDAAIKGIGGPESITISQFKTQFENEYLESVKLRSDTQRNESNSIKHYDLFREVKHRYGKNKLHTGPCDRMAARIRLGYRKIWQIQYESNGIIHEEYSKCTLCNHPLGNTLEHYISSCPKLRHFRPTGVCLFHELCVHFCKPEVLYPILNVYPEFRF